MIFLPFSGLVRGYRWGYDTAHLDKYNESSCLGDGGWGKDVYPHIYPDLWLSKNESASRLRLSRDGDRHDFR